MRWIVFLVDEYNKLVTTPANRVNLIMNLFQTLIMQFDKILKDDNPIEYAKLQYPLKVDEVEDAMNKLGIYDMDFRNLYLWKNGEADDSFCQLIECGGPLSLKNISSIVNELSYPYDSSLIPFISEGEEMLLFNTKRGDHYGKIYFFSVPQLYIDFPISYYDSIHSMIETTMAAYKEKIYVYDFSKNMLTYDFEKLHNHIQKNNPRSAYWIHHDPLSFKDQL